MSLKRACLFFNPSLGIDHIAEKLMKAVARLKQASGERCVSLSLARARIHGPSITRTRTRGARRSSRNLRRNAKIVSQFVSQPSLPAVHGFTCSVGIKYELAVCKESSRERTKCSQRFVALYMYTLAFKSILTFSLLFLLIMRHFN